MRVVPLAQLAWRKKWEKWERDPNAAAEQYSRPGYGEKCPH